MKNKLFLKKSADSVLFVSLWQAQAALFWVKATFLTVNCEAHQIQTLTTMKIPTLHKWMCFSLTSCCVAVFSKCKMIFSVTVK